MILRIYWTDRYQRRATGKRNSTHGLRLRLAQYFGVSEEVIKKIIGLPDTRNRTRFRKIAVGEIKRAVRERLQRRGVNVSS